MLKLKHSVCLFCTAFVVVLLVWGLRGQIQATFALRQTARAWRAEGPHTTALGTLRRSLRAAWWLGFLRPSAPPDPLQKCKVQAWAEDDLSWLTDAWRLWEAKKRLACLQEETAKARKDHERLKSRVLRFGLKLAVILAVFFAALHSNTCRWYVAEMEKTIRRLLAPREKREATYHVHLAPHVTVTFHVKDLPQDFTADDMYGLIGVLRGKANALKHHVMRHGVDSAVVKAFVDRADLFFQERQHSLHDSFPSSLSSRLQQAVLGFPWHPRLLP